MRHQPHADIRKGGGGKAGGGKGGSTWLAMGVIVTRWLPDFRWRSGLHPGVSWRYVTTAAVHRGDARFAVVDCPDVFFANATKFGRDGQPKIQMGFQFSCFCKTVSWFAQALTLVPGARFIGKMEDDSVLHDARVVAELALAYRLARRAEATSGAAGGLGGPKLPRIWYGHFAWAAFVSPTGDGEAKFCGDGDALLTATRVGCGRAAQLGTLAPFASGGLDIRSRALAEDFRRCDPLWQFVRGYDPANASYSASCDGQQGYFVARCLLEQPPDGTPAAAAAADGRDAASAASAADGTRLATLWHLPWPKFHPPSRRHGARLHTSLMHPHRARAGCTATPPARGCHADDMEPTWRWNMGHGLLPFRYVLRGALKPNGARSTWWEPHNRSALALYNRLHRHREDDRYCDVLPCGLAGPAGGAGARAPLTAAALNATPCGSMLECVASPQGGRYFYAGPLTGTGV